MNFMKRILCRNLLKEAIRGSQNSKKYGLGMVLPEKGVRKLKISNEGATEYNFYVDEALQDYYLVSKDSRRILFVGSTNTTEFDKTHTTEEIIRHDLESHWSTVMCISAFVNADGNRELENDAIDKFGDRFLSSLLSGKIKFHLHFD